MGSKRLVPLLFALLSACQSYQDGVAVVCNAPLDCPECLDKSPDQRAYLLAKHIEDRLYNRQARALFKALGAADVQTKRTILQEEAKAAGLRDCPLTSIFERTVADSADKTLGAADGDAKDNPSPVKNDLGSTHDPIETRSAPSATANPLGKKEIAAVIDGRRTAIRYCYEKQLLKNPKMEGRVDLEFRIDPDGRVKQARVVNSDLDSKAVELCILKIVEGLRFAAPKGAHNVTVKYPFVFRVDS